MQMDGEDAEAQRDHEEDMKELETPAHSDLDETETEDEDAPSPKLAQPARKAKGNLPKKELTAPEVDESPESPELPPPRRELPFTRHNTRSKPTTSPPPLPAKVYEDETTDDEL